MTSIIYLHFHFLHTGFNCHLEALSVCLSKCVGSSVKGEGGGIGLLTFDQEDVATYLFWSLLHLECKLLYWILFKALLWQSLEAEVTPDVLQRTSRWLSHIANRTRCCHWSANQGAFKFDHLVLVDAPFFYRDLVLYGLGDVSCTAAKVSG